MRTAASAEYEMNFEIKFRAEINPIDSNGDLLEVDHKKEHFLKVKCLENEIYCEDMHFLLYPELNYENFKITI